MDDLYVLCECVSYWNFCVNCFVNFDVEKCYTDILNNDSNCDMYVVKKQKCLMDSATSLFQENTGSLSLTFRYL